MPRRKSPRLSIISPEHIINYDQNESLNLSDELPDPGLQIANTKDTKDKKRVSFNFPVEVVTREGNYYTGMGTIDLREPSSPVKALKPESDLYKITYDLSKNAAKTKDQIKQKSENVEDTKKTQEPVIDLEASEKVDLTKDKEPSGKPATAVQNNGSKPEIDQNKISHDLTQNAAKPKDRIKKKSVNVEDTKKVQKPVRNLQASKKVDLAKNKEPSGKPATAVQNNGSKPEKDQNKISYDVNQNTAKPKNQNKSAKVQETKKSQKPVRNLEAPKKIDLTKDKEPSGKPATAVQNKGSKPERDLTQNAAKTKDRIKQKSVNVQETKKTQEPVIDLKAPKKVDLTKDKKPSGKPTTAVQTQQNNPEVATKSTSIKAAKETKRKEAEISQEATKESKEDENGANAEDEELNKVYKPGECLKYVTMELHAELSGAWYARELVQAMVAVGVRMRASSRDPGMITWTCGSSTYPRAVYVLPAQRVVEPTVGALLAKLHNDFPGRLSVAVFGVRQLISTLPVEENIPPISRDMFTKIINELQMELIVKQHIDVVAAETPRELAQLIMHFTRAIAEAPYKKAKRDIDEQAEFYMRGDNKNCVTVDQHGNGLKRLWEQSLAVLPKSSLEIARSLSAQYKTPKALLQEFKTTGGIAKVADVGVTRDNAPEAKTRRVGPEFARKLHILFTTVDGNTVIE